MVAAAETNPEIRKRTEFYQFRAPEEFYDLRQDRFERDNLIANASSQAEIASMRGELLALMKRTGDPFSEAFEHRERKELIPEVIIQRMK